MKVHRIIYVLLILFGATSYGILSPLIKSAYQQGFGNEQITSFQMTLGAIMVWILILFHKKSWQNPFKGPWIRLSFIGICGLAGTTLFFNTCLVYVDASLAIILLFQFTWITISANCIAQKRAPSNKEIIAVILILLGTLLAVNAFEVDWNQLSTKGIVYGLLSACSYSLFLFMTGNVETTLTSLMKTAVMLTAALPAVYIVYMPITITHEQIFPLLIWGLILGFFGQVIPTISFNAAIPKLGSSFSAILGSAELPVAVIASLFILSEPVQLLQWLGISVILVGIVISEK